MEWHGELLLLVALFHCIIYYEFMSMLFCKKAVVHYFLGFAAGTAKHCMPQDYGESLVFYTCKYFLKEAFRIIFAKCS